VKHEGDISDCKQDHDKECEDNEQKMKDFKAAMDDVVHHEGEKEYKAGMDDVVHHEGKSER
jgi:hypothetical protein